MSQTGVPELATGLLILQLLNKYPDLTILAVKEAVNLAIDTQGRDTIISVDSILSIYFRAESTLKELYEI